MADRNQNQQQYPPNYYAEEEVDEEAQEAADVFTNSYLQSFNQTQSYNMQRNSMTSSVGSFEYDPQNPTRRPSQMGLITNSYLASGGQDSGGYWPQGGQQQYGRGQEDFEDDESEVSFDYADFDEAAKKEANQPRTRTIKRSPQTMGSRYIGGRWSRFEFILFLVLNVGQVVLLVVGLLIYLIGIPLFVQGQIQNVLDGKKSNLPTPKIELKQVAVGPFTSTNFPITIAVDMPAIIPLIPISLTIGTIVIDNSLPSLQGPNNQIATITTTPISLTVSQPININTTITFGLNADQQTAIKQFISKGIDPDAQINVDVAVPVKLFFLQIYNPMRLKLHLIPSVFLKSVGNPAALLPPPGPGQNAMLKQKLSYKDSDLVSLGPLGAGLNDLVPKFDDSGISADLGADYEMTLPAYLAPIPSFSGYLGLGGNQRIAQFYAKNISLSPGLQSTRMQVGISFTESRINLQQARAAMAKALAGFQSGSAKLSDLGLALMGPIEMPNVDFLNNISQDLAILVPTSLLAGAAGAAKDTPASKLLTNDGLVDVINKSNFVFHLLPRTISFRVVLPPFLPLPQSNFSLPFNASLYIANPNSGTEIVHVETAQLQMSRDSQNNLISKASIVITPISFSLDTIEQGINLGKGLLTAGRVAVQARNISLFSPTNAGFKFFTQQLPVPPVLNNTLDFCQGCFARVLVTKVISSGLKLT